MAHFFLHSIRFSRKMISQILILMNMGHPLDYGFRILQQSIKDDMLHLYINAFANHVPEFSKLHGSLSKFNQQGLEKLNDLETKEYLRSTNQCSKNLQAFEQLLSNKNQREYLEDEGFARTHHHVLCSNCKTVGHHHTTCLRRVNSS